MLITLTLFQNLPPIICGNFNITIPSITIPEISLNERSHPVALTSHIIIGRKRGNHFNFFLTHSPKYLSVALIKIIVSKVAKRKVIGIFLLNQQLEQMISRHHYDVQAQY